MKHITLILGFTVTLFGQRLETALDEIRERWQRYIVVLPSVFSFLRYFRNVFQEGKLARRRLKNVKEFSNDLHF